MINKDYCGFYVIGPSLASLTIHTTKDKRSMFF